MHELFLLEVFIVLLLQMAMRIRTMTEERSFDWVVSLSTSLDNFWESNLCNISNDRVEIKNFEDYILHLPKIVSRATDGENIDAVEHFFWGIKNGSALELGALDGTPQTHSMTYDLQNHFGWKRILIEGIPQYRNILRTAKDSVAINAVICRDARLVHYIRGGPNVGGIVEFMTPHFLKGFHYSLYKAGLVNNS